MASALDTLRDPVRTKAVRELGRVGGPRLDAIGRLLRLATELTDSSAAVVSLVAPDRQILLSHVGLPPAVEGTETPIDYSVCQHVVTRNKPLVVSDMAAAPAWRDHPTHLELGVRAYAGIPLVTGGGLAIGAFCVMDFEAHEWPADALSRLALLAQLAMDELELHGHERMDAFRRSWSGVPERRTLTYR